MTFLEKIKAFEFRLNMFKIAVPFFIIVTLFSLVINSGGALFSGDFESLNEVNFSEGKWQKFWAVKIVVSLLYSFYITVKKTK